MSDASLNFEFTYRDRPFAVRVVPGEHLALLYNGVVRKERQNLGREPLYVWTNVELEWEEHHYVEVRYWPTSGEVRATVNGEPLQAWQVSPAK